MNDAINSLLATEATSARMGQIAWSVANDRAATFCNGVISVSVVALDGRWVVSVFFCGADGRPDYDRGEHSVESYSTREEAMRFFVAWRTVSCLKGIRAARRQRMGV